MVASGELTFGDLSHGGIQMERDRFDQYVPRELLAKAFALEWLDLRAARELAGALVDLSRA